MLCFLGKIKNTIVTPIREVSWFDKNLSDFQWQYTCMYNYDKVKLWDSRGDKLFSKLVKGKMTFLMLKPVYAQKHNMLKCYQHFCVGQENILH